MASSWVVERVRASVGLGGPAAETARSSGRDRCVGRKVVVRRGLPLLVAASIVTSSAAAQASATLVQNDTATGTTSVVATWALAGGVTAGHLLVATVAAASGSTIGAPAGWTLIASLDNPTKVMVAMYYIQNCPAKAQNTTETFTATGSNGTTVRLMEFSGI